MDEATDDNTKDPGPFQQRSDPAAEPEDAVAVIMDESTDGDSHHQQAWYHSRAPYPEEHVTNDPKTAHEPPQTQLTNRKAPMWVTPRRNKWAWLVVGFISILRHHLADDRTMAPLV